MNDRKIPNPEQVQKEFEDFVKQRFGGAAQVFSKHSNSSPEETSHQYDTKEVPDEFPFSYTPKDIKEYLDQFVIKQDEAKKALAIAICDHYYHAQKLQQSSSADYEYNKQNVLILGPTGVGKTYLIKKVAELLGVPFVKADATRFSETGYVGSNVDDLIRDLVNRAEGDIKKAQYGIVYLDEADKLAGKQTNGRDVNGRGVQFGLLRLMEECEVDLKSGNDIHSQIQAFMEMQSGKTKSKVNTRYILFIVSGAFSGLEKIIEKRLRKKTMGFHRDNEIIDTAAILDQASTEDFLEFGFEAEFIGRLPIRVACQNLEEEDLYKVLTDSKGSILHQFRASFASFGIKLDFSEEALHRIAHLAKLEQTGARSLLTVCERILRPFKFELPGSGVEHFTVSLAVVMNPQQELQILLDTLQKKSASHVSAREELEFFTKDFYEQYGIQLSFSDQLLNKILEHVEETGTPLLSFVEKMLASYGHGLMLIQKNTGQSIFALTEKVYYDSKKYLENLIIASYSQVESENT